MPFTERSVYIVTQSPENEKDGNNQQMIEIVGMAEQEGRMPPQILADQLTLSQPVGTDYAHLITTCTPGFSDLSTALPGIF